MKAYIFTIAIGTNNEKHDCYAEGVDMEAAQDALIDAIEAEGRVHGNIYCIKRTELLSLPR